MKKDFFIAVIAILLTVVACFALAGIRPDFPLSPSQPFTGKPASSAAKKTGKVVMHVNGEPVTEAEFNAYAEDAPAEQRMFLISSAEGRRVLANEIVKLKMLELEARRLGIANDPAVRTQMEKMQSQLFAGRALEALVKEKVDARILAEYEKQKTSAIALKHIVFAYAGGQLPPRGGTAPTEQQAMQKAGEVAAKLRAGADFAALARTESDDQQSAQNGGSLGATRRESLPPEIASVVGNLQPGQNSAPVRTAYGVHIFRVDVPSIDDLRPALTRQVQETAVRETLEGLQQSAKVDLDPAFFQTGPTAPGGAPGGAPKPNG